MFTTACKKDFKNIFFLLFCIIVHIKYTLVPAIPEYSEQHYKSTKNTEGVTMKHQLK